MSGRIFLRVVLTLVLAAAIVGFGAYVYNAGVSQGIAEGARLTPRESGAVPYYGPYARPFFGFGCFGLLVPLFFLFLIFGLMRALFWRGPWGRGRMHEDHWGKGAPAMFEEWHRRMHEPKSGEAAPASDSSTGKV